jgi:hypothetical protein
MAEPKEITHVFRCLKEGFVSYTGDPDLTVEEAEEHIRKNIGYFYISVPGTLGSGEETGDAWELQEHVDTF